MFFNLRRIYTSSLFWYLLVSLTVSICLAWFQVPDSALHIFFCDVGQGDAFILKYRNLTVLVDGGPGKDVLTCLDTALPFWERDIDLLVLSHPHADHVTGLVHVLENYRVRNALLAFSPYSSEVYSAFLNTLVSNNIPTIKAFQGQVIVLEPLCLEVVWPPKFCYQSDINYCSVVVDARYKQFSALLTGDFSNEAQKSFLILSGFDNTNVLKVPHQGAQDSLYSELLLQSEPELAVISVGANNRFGHPSRETLKMLQDFGVTVKRTDLDGTIEIVSDGSNWFLR